jgi:hypothetical protein
MGAGVDEAELRRRAGDPGMTGLDLATTVSTTAHPLRRRADGDRSRVGGGGRPRDEAGHRPTTHRRGLDVTVVPAALGRGHPRPRSRPGCSSPTGRATPSRSKRHHDRRAGLLGRSPSSGSASAIRCWDWPRGRTFKLPFGHHGGNHPVRRLADGKVEITAQNHGFAVDLWSLTDRRRSAPGGSGVRRVAPRTGGRPVVGDGGGPPTRTSTTGRWRASAASTSPPSGSSTTRRPPPARATPSTCSTNSRELMGLDA